MTPKTRAFAVLAVALLLAGCISTSKTEYIDEQKVAVSFESNRAEKLFFEGMAKNKGLIASVGRPQEKTHVSLILINVSEQKVTSGPNRDFNQAVRFCDTNHDGVITEHEAEMFASLGGKPPAAASAAPAGQG